MAFFVLPLIVFSNCVFAQQHSHNGWALTTKDTLRILLVFVEIQYDTLPNLEDLPEGNYDWPKSGLPGYADEIFHPFYTPSPTAIMTRYYHESSLGNLIVLGDYIPKLFKVPYSKMLSRGQYVIFETVSAEIASMGEVVTNAGLKLDDFDLWKKSPGRGLEIAPANGEFTGVDHVMVLTRNYHSMPKDNGQASPSSFGILGGYRTDTYSIFSGGHSLPFGILKHELNHLFLGGNNFHSGGGNSSRFLSYTLSVQGGWSMMGAANSSLLTCNAWDRYRLGWKAEGNEFLISALDSNGKEANGDLDANRADDAGVYILRDFQSKGDAIRIKLPYIPDTQFEQWLWLENHATTAINGSPFDNYKYSDAECASSALPGLFMAVQIDTEKKEGKDVYGYVLADNWKPIPANGMYDTQCSSEELQLKQCVNTKAYKTYELLEDFENPLSGNHEQENIYAQPADSFRQLSDSDFIPPMIRKVGDAYQRLNFLGDENHNFRPGYKSMMGIGTNPTAASVLTFVNARKPRKAHKRNNTTIYLNGIGIKILEHYSDGSMKVSIRFDDHILDSKRRWCAPFIVLNNHNAAGADLLVTGHLILDRGQTPTRFDEPAVTEDGVYFTDPTTLTIAPEAQMVNDGLIELKKSSQITVSQGATLLLERRSKVNLEGGTHLNFEVGATLVGRGRIRIEKGAAVFCEDEATHKLARRRTFQKNRVLVQSGQLNEENTP